MIFMDCIVKQQYNSYFCMKTNNLQDETNRYY